ncbi:MAG: hypothetical protein ACP5KV_02555 [Candidatus Methanomethylicaceae archaeon]
MASKEADPVRKKELERIAETCRWVPASLIAEARSPWLSAVGSSQNSVKKGNII